MRGLTLALAAIGIATAGSAMADPLAALQPSCQGHGKLEELLAQEFDEVPTALGLQSNGQLIQVYASKDGTTWTIVTTRPDGLSCIVALGRHWQALEAPTTDPMA